MVLWCHIANFRSLGHIDNICKNEGGGQEVIILKGGKSQTAYTSWIPTGLFLIGHTCHRIENGGGLHNNSNPGSGNSILLGTGASPPVSGNSILNTNTMKKIWKGIFFLGHTAILCPMTRIPFGKIPFSALALRRLTNLTQSAWSNTNIFYNEKSDFVVVQLGGGYIAKF